MMTAATQTAAQLIAQQLAQQVQEEADAYGVEIASVEYAGPCYLYIVMDSETKGGHNVVMIGVTGKHNLWVSQEERGNGAIVTERVKEHWRGFIENNVKALGWDIETFCPWRRMTEITIRRDGEVVHRENYPMDMRGALSFCGGYVGQTCESSNNAVPDNFEVTINLRDGGTLTVSGDNLELSSSV